MPWLPKSHLKCHNRRKMENQCNFILLSSKELTWFPPYILASSIGKSTLGCDIVLAQGPGDLRMGLEHNLKEPKAGLIILQLSYCQALCVP